MWALADQIVAETNPAAMGTVAEMNPAAMGTAMLSAPIYPKSYLSMPRCLKQFGPLSLMYKCATLTTLTEISADSFEQVESVHPSMSTCLPFLGLEGACGAERRVSVVVVVVCMCVWGGATSGGGWGGGSCLAQ